MIIIDLSQCGRASPLLILSKSSLSTSPSLARSSNCCISRFTMIFFSAMRNTSSSFAPTITLSLVCLLMGLCLERFIRGARFLGVDLS